MIARLGGPLPACRCRTCAHIVPGEANQLPKSVNAIHNLCFTNMKVANPPETELHLHATQNVPHCIPIQISLKNRVFDLASR